jgi:hypothetical protein
MIELGMTEISLIIRDIRRQKIVFSHLCDDLIDHVCCDVEQEMESGVSFDQAYRKVKEKIGLGGLTRIQEDTLYTVDTKYRKMKNTMKITGVAGTVLLGFAAMLKLMHWPGAGILLVTGAFVLALLFMPSSLVVLWKESKSRRSIFLFITGFLAGVLFITGILFKIQHWPGAGMVISLALFCGGFLFLPALLVVKLQEEEAAAGRWLYITGFVATLLYLAGFWMKIMHWPFASLLFAVSGVFFLAVIPWYVYHTWKDEKKVDAAFIYMVIALVAYLLPTTLLDLNLQQNYDAGFFGHASGSETMIAFQKKSNAIYLECYHDSVTSGVMDEVHMRTSEVLDRIEMIKQRMTDLSGGMTSTVPGSSVDKYNYLRNPFDPVSTRLMLFPRGETRIVLDSLLRGYMEEIQPNLAPGERSPAPDYRLLIALLPDQPQNADGYSLITSLHALNSLESAVLLTESAAFRNLALQKDNHE